MATPPMLQPREAAAFRMPGEERPDPVVSIAVFLLAVTVAGLLLGAVLAVYDWKTPAALRPLFYSVLAVFLASLTVLVAASAIRGMRRAIRGTSR